MEHQPIWVDHLRSEPRCLNDFIEWIDNEKVRIREQVFNQATEMIDILVIRRVSEELEALKFIVTYPDIEEAQTDGNMGQD